MNISVDDYVMKLVDMCFIKVTCMARIKKTNQVHFDYFTFILDKPVLDVEVYVNRLHRI